MHKTLRRALVLVGVLVAYSAVCPSVCLAARAHMAAAHICCPDANPQEAPSGPVDMPPCCEGHGQVVLADGVVTVAPLLLQGMAMLPSSLVRLSAGYALTVTATNHLALVAAERPLYLIHNVFRT